MAELDKNSFEVKYNDSSIGLFKANTTQNRVTSQDRQLVTDLKDSVVWNDEVATTYNNYRGDWAGTTAFPDTGDGGTYDAGAPGAGNRWRLTDTLVIDGNVYAPGTIIEAAIDSPGQILANWNKYAMQL